MSNGRRLRRTAWIAGPGWTGGPSPAARALLDSPALTGLPAGVWHTSADMAPVLASAQPVVTEATHAATGAKFKLASHPDGQILSISAEDDKARELVAVAWSDPSAWANGEQWWIAPPTEGATRIAPSGSDGQAVQGGNPWQIKTNRTPGAPC